jgi:hypothetical protein
MTLQDTARAMIEAYFDKGDFQRDLAALVARPTESQDPRGKSHLHAYLRDDMAPMLDAMGFARRFHDNPEPDGPPILTAERIEDLTLPIMRRRWPGRSRHAAGYSRCSCAPSRRPAAPLAI